MNNKNLVITSILFSGGILLYFIIKKYHNKIIQTKTIATDYEKFSISDYIVIKPDVEDKYYDVVFVFGGMDYATPNWMLDQIPDEILLNNIVVLATYHNKYADVNSAIKKYLNTKNYGIRSVSIVGFSAGGYRVFEAYDKNFKFVGLIDPSNNSTYNKLQFGSNVRMLYNKDNWGSYPSIKANMDFIAGKIKNAGGIANNTSLSHSKIPQEFFEKYKNELN